MAAVPALQFLSPVISGKPAPPRSPWQPSDGGIIRLKDYHLQKSDCPGTLSQEFCYPAPVEVAR